MDSKIIAIDFDGVIHQYNKGWHDGSLYGEPVEGAFDKLQLLHDCGYEIVIHTTRTNHKDIRVWMLEHMEDTYNFVFEITNVKPVAKFYIDNRALRFTNWEDTIKYIQ